MQIQMIKNQISQNQFDVFQSTSIFETQNVSLRIIGPYNEQTIPH